jgi:PAS domain-containing protein
MPASLPGLSPEPETIATQVVIIGAGDGGIQEFLGLITGGLKTRQIMERIANALGDRNFAYRALFRLFDSESTAQRHLVHGNESEGKPLTSSLSDQFTDEIDELFRNDSQLMNDVLGDLTKFHDVLVFHNAPSLGQCYAINRFLALAFNRYLRSYSPHSEPFRFGWTAEHVECLADHDVNSSDPADHAAGGHLLTLLHQKGSELKVCCRTVISRLGPASTSKGTYIRQLLPLWLPHWGPLKQAKTSSRKQPGTVEPWNDRGWRRALWKFCTGRIVMKDSEGRVEYLNRHFADGFGGSPEQILGQKAAVYAEDIAALVERHDKFVRTKLASLFTYSNLGREPHYSLRFPLPLGHRTIGSASLGFAFDPTLIKSRTNDLPEPPAQQLERFFEWLPFSVAVTDADHRLKYANQAFRRLFTPAHLACVPALDLYNLTWDELVAKFDPATSPQEAEPANQRRKSAWDRKSPITWYAVSPFRRQQRFVFAFPILNPSGKMIALGSVGMLERYIREANKQADASFFRRYKLDIDDRSLPSSENLAADA